MNDEEHIKEFIHLLHENIRYWHEQDNKSEKEKLEGMTFSILVALDGCSGSWDGDIGSLEECCRHIMLHDSFYENQQG